MHILISIDDTDNLNSPGSGQHAASLANELLSKQLVNNHSGISRHQLFYSDDIAYTSHNSAMCFEAETKGTNLDSLTHYCMDYLETNSAQGSDPGLCIAHKADLKSKTPLIQFGKKAKQEVITKEDAYSLACHAGVHLSEHGGTGNGVIGAIAGVGLRLSGNDGRFRGWLDFGQKGSLLSVKDLCEHQAVNEVVTDDGEPLPKETLVMMGVHNIKTLLNNHIQAIVVQQSQMNQNHSNPSDSCWTTLTKKQIKKY